MKKPTLNIKKPLIDIKVNPNCKKDCKLFTIVINTTCKPKK